MLFAGIGWWISRSEDVGGAAVKNQPSQASSTTTVPSSPARPATRAPRLEELQKISPHPDAVSFGQGKPEDEPAKLLELFEVYRREFGAFPSGEDNLQMMHALCGANPRKLGVFPLDHPRLDSQLGLLDAWDRPFVFHQISSEHLEIRSIGQDGELFSADDLVVPGRRNR